MLPDNDPVLGEAPGDSALHCLLVQSSQVYVRVGGLVRVARGGVGRIPWEEGGVRRSEEEEEKKEEEEEEEEEDI